MQQLNTEKHDNILQRPNTLQHSPYKQEGERRGDVLAEEMCKSWKAASVLTCSCTEINMEKAKIEHVSALGVKLHIVNVFMKNISQS